MRLKLGLIIAAGLVWFFSMAWRPPLTALSAWSAEPHRDAPLRPMTLDLHGRRGVVTFSHQKHEAQVHPDPSYPHPSPPGRACIGCHHKVEQVTDAAQYKKCSACHRAEGDPENPEDKQGYELSAREAFHRACIGCHVASRVVASNHRQTNVSFTKCNECHDRQGRIEIAAERVNPQAADYAPPAGEPKIRAANPIPEAARAPVDAPLGYAGVSRIPMPEPMTPGAIPTPDRWRIGFPDHPRYQRGSRWNSYRQNYLKGDYPILGQHTFLNLAAESESAFNYRRLPGAADVSNRGTDLFTRGSQYFFRQNFTVSFDLSHGDTAFRPVDWRINITPQFNLNYLHVQRPGIVNADPARGVERTDGYVALQAAFVEVRLGDTPGIFPFLRGRDSQSDDSPYFDSTSVRTGIQPFISDFRGFIFSDANLGVRLFGNHANNHYQFNLAWFQMLEKDVNSELNRPRFRDQSVFVANVYRQDLWWNGYNAQLSFHFNHDAGSRRVDDNGFVVRPAPVGGAAPHDLKVAYFGWAGEGHAGRLNLSHALYQALGRDASNPVAGRRVDINAQMAAAELSYNRDWLRFRSSFFYASGDKQPLDGTARGFDSILDLPEFAGGRFSFWNNQGLRLIRTSANLVNPGSLLPNLRSHKTAGQANFVNPGILIYNVGLEGDLTQKLKAIFNLNYLHFAHPEPLDALLRCADAACPQSAAPIPRRIGLDYGFGVRFRPWLSENAILEAGYSSLVPGAGMRQIYGPGCVSAGCETSGRLLHSIFVRSRFVY